MLGAINATRLYKTHDEPVRTLPKFPALCVESGTVVQMNIAHAIEKLPLGVNASGEDSILKFSLSVSKRRYYLATAPGLGSLLRFLLSNSRALCRG